MESLPTVGPNCSRSIEWSQDPRQFSRSLQVSSKHFQGMGQRKRYPIRPTSSIPCAIANSQGDSAARRKKGKGCRKKGKGCNDFQEVKTVGKVDQDASFSRQKSMANTMYKRSKTINLGENQWQCSKDSKVTHY
mmetsp:Transcript_24751/g.60815  ORF Transcript_24751/g.60815 Transcript_24751/m.60815 type:complete len:134 (-) Transcript_24751:1371-1772(-)